MHIRDILLSVLLFDISLSLCSPTPAPAKQQLKESDDDDDDDNKGSSIAKTIGSSLLGSLANSSSVLGTFLGDGGTVIFQNGLVKMLNANGTTAAGATCPSMSVIFARGTLEPGNVGILTGPPFFAAMAAVMNGTNQLAIQGVPYPADISGFLAGGSKVGAVTMAALINSTLSTCPSTQLLVSGYSQGAQLVHESMAMLPNTTTSKIAGVVMFGDPLNGTALSGVDSSRVLTVCHAGDDICKGGDAVLKEHLTYSADAGQAAMFAFGSAGARLGISSAEMRMEADGGIGG